MHSSVYHAGCLYFRGYSGCEVSHQIKYLKHATTAAIHIFASINHQIFYFLESLAIHPIFHLS